jgi:acetylornithine/succinyldiaminopimelate/putrescine aminotransferase
LIGDLGSTFGGGPIACTAINFVINYITEKELLKNVKERELEIRRECLLGPVRKIQGKGFLLGLVCDQPALKVQKKLLKKNILTGTSADKKVLRLLPPLVLQSSHIERLREALTTV